MIVQGQDQPSDHATTIQEAPAERVIVVVPAKAFAVDVIAAVAVGAEVAAVAVAVAVAATEVPEDVPDPEQDGWPTADGEYDSDLAHVLEVIHSSVNEMIAYFVVGSAAAAAEIVVTYAVLLGQND